MEPTSRSAYAFCQGDRGAMGRSRMPHGLQSPTHGMTIGRIAVSNQVTRHLTQWEGVSNLPRDPLCCRAIGNPDTPAENLANLEAGYYETQASGGKPQRAGARALGFQSGIKDAR